MFYWFEMSDQNPKSTYIKASVYKLDPHDVKRFLSSKAHNHTSKEAANRLGKHPFSCASERGLVYRIYT